MIQLSGERHLGGRAARAGSLRKEHPTHTLRSGEEQTTGRPREQGHDEDQSQG